MSKPILYTRLLKLKKNHQDNMNSPFITHSITIERDHLQRFIDQAATIPNCDAIRIHFVRHELNKSEGHVEKIDGKNLSQVSLALVPAKIIDQTDWIAIDLKGQNNDIFTLLVCEPTGAARGSDDKTGQCPPKPPVCPDDEPPA